MRDLFLDAAQRAARYREELSIRSVLPSSDAIRRLAILDEPLPEKSTDAQDVLHLLDEIGSPATVATAGGRFFGFVSNRNQFFLGFIAIKPPGPLCNR